VVDSYFHPPKEQAVIDHVTLRVHDLAASKAFYAAALAPLGYAVVMDFPEAVGLGVAGQPDFWLTEDKAASPQHVAFAAPSRAAVDAFHAAGLAAGGKDNGAPGLRLHYHPNYYGAFIDDPSGHHMEAVIHAPPGARQGPSKSAAKAASRKAAPRKRAPRKGAARKAGAGKAARKGARKPGRR
jgi:catechol 2,3-dioxygenase-like lactoylglutathione lyase family enzyme